MKLTYLLDTNVVSELAKPVPDPRVLSRFARHEGRLGMPALVWHELLYAVARLPPGRRKDRLRAFLLDVVQPGLPVLPYDERRHSRNQQPGAGDPQPRRFRRLSGTDVRELVRRGVLKFFPFLFCSFASQAIIVI
jgi:hypothetical protein